MGALIPTKDKDTLFNNVLDNLNQVLNIDTDTPGLIITTLTDIITSDLSDLYSVTNDFDDSVKFTTATGDSLDVFGEMVSEFRDIEYTAQDNTKTAFKFYLNDSISNLYGISEEVYLNDPIIIYPDQIITSVIDPDIQYKVTEGGMFYYDDTELYCNVEALFAGSDYNVNKNELIQHDYTGFGVEYLKCTNVQPIVGGTNILDDDNYKNNISNKVLGTEIGNIASIKLAALNTPGINNVIITPKSHGIGTFSIFIVSDLPLVSDGLILALNNNLANVVPEGVTYYINKPNYLSINIKMTLILRQSATISEDEITSMRESVTNYINNLGLGGTIVISDMIQLLKNFNSNIQDVDIYKFCVSKLDPSTFELTDIHDLLLTNQTADKDSSFISYKVDIGV